jgi:DNA polymerase IV
LDAPSKVMRRILHVDMDAFFVAVELRRHPELRGKPVVVGGHGDPTQRGVVSTASYEARKFGIHSAMALRIAYRLCPQAVFLPVDYSEYERVSATFKAVLREVSPLLEEAGIDEAFLDISEQAQRSEAIAQTIKGRIGAATGLTCSIGIAPNKLLAKIASDMQKPDGLTIIDEGDISKRIWPLPVAKLPGVGPKTERRLHELGVKSIGDLARVPREVLSEHFGQAHGRYLYEASRGIDVSPVITHWEPKSSGRQITFQKDVVDRQVLVNIIDQLARELASELQKLSYKARTIAVRVRFNDFDTHSRQQTLDDPIDSPEALKTVALACLGRIEFEKPVRLIGLRVAVLRNSGQESGKLAPDKSATE